VVTTGALLADVLAMAGLMPVAGVEDKMFDDFIVRFCQQTVEIRPHVGICGANVGDIVFMTVSYFLLAAAFSQASVVLMGTGQRGMRARCRAPVSVCTTDAVRSVRTR
jgi:hypothetical protein